MHTTCSVECPSHTSYAFLLSKLYFLRDLSRFSGPSRPVPVFAAVDRPRRSRHRHHRGEPLVMSMLFLLLLLLVIIALDRYLSNFLTFIIACYYIVRWF